MTAFSFIFQRKEYLFAYSFLKPIISKELAMFMRRRQSIL